MVNSKETVSQNRLIESLSDPPTHTHVYFLHGTSWAILPASCISVTCWPVAHVR